MVNGTVRGVPADLSGCSVWALVGDRLRARRVQLGITVERVAEELGIEPKTYEGYEAGAAQTRALLQIIDIATLFDVPVSWFFRDVAAPDDARPKSAGDRHRPYVYRVATQEQRIDHLADSFGNLDLERQQCLLAIAAALSGTDEKRARKPGQRDRRAARPRKRAAGRVSASPANRTRRASRSRPS